MKHKFVSIAGNIGSGKTTAAKLIQQHFGYELFEEPVIDNRFLKEYYSNMERWSMTLQFEFLIKRFKHQKLIASIEKPSVQDRTLIEDPEIFAKYLNSLGYMKDKELALYQDYFNEFSSQIPKPDMIIYLKNENIDTLLNRIHNIRGREEEKGITYEFLDGLNNHYRNFTQTATKKYQIPVFSIDGEYIDIKTPEGKLEFKKKLEEILQ